MNIKYHKSCSTLPIYNFYKIMEDNNLRFLIKGYSEEDGEVEVTKEANIIFQEILQEYSELTSNQEILIGMKLELLILEYEFEVNTLQRILEIFEETKDFSVLSLLSEFGFDINESSDLNASFKPVIKRIKGLKNKIRINKVKYSKRFKKNKEKIKSNLEKEALILELNLQLGREINVHTTTVSKWITMIEISKNKAMELEKTLNRK